METAAVDATHRTFISYIDKSRDYYRAHGYDKPYRWASNDTAPFHPLSKPLSQSRAALVTTTGLHRLDRPDNGPTHGPKLPYAHPTSPPPKRMFTSDLSWDKEATHTEDVESFLPIERLRGFVESGRLASLADRFYGVPTEYSQRRTGQDAETIESWCREDDVDVVVLVPL